MPSHGPPREILESIEQLLLLSPNGDRKADLIVSTAPGIWGDQQANDTLFVDVSLIVGNSPWRDIQPSRFDSQLETLVYEKVLEAGWSEASVRLQLRSGKGLHADIGLCDQEGQLVCAIDVGRVRSRMIGLTDRTVRSVFEYSDASAVCFTDGNQYLIVNREGVVETLDAVPPPERFQLQSVRRDRSVVKNTPIRPSTIESLVAVLDEHAPRDLLVDHTLPWGQRIDRGSELATLITELNDDIPGTLESFQAMLAWLSMRESTESIATLCAPSIAFNSSTTWLRNLIQHRLGLHAHIEFPCGTFSPATGIAPAFFRFQRSSKHVYFDAIGSTNELRDIEARPWFTSYVAFLKGNEPSQGFVKPNDQLDDWTVARNDPLAEDLLERLENLGETRELGDICEVLSGPHIPSEHVSQVFKEGYTRIIDGRSLRDSDEFDDQESQRFVTDGYQIRERNLLQPGDVLINRVSQQTGYAKLFTSDIPAVASNSVMVLRPKPELQSEYLVEFFNSTAGRALIHSRSTGLSVRQMSISTMRSLKIPLVDLNIDMSEAMLQVDEVHNRLINTAQEIDRRRLTLFSSQNANQLQNELTDLKRRSSLLASSLRLADSLEFQISQFYPFPLAYSYGLLASYVDPRQLLEEQLRVAENTVAFLASTAIALLTEEDRAALSIAFRNAWQGGISIGAWRELMARCSKLLAVYRDHPLASSLVRLNAGSSKKGFGKHLETLVDRRNAWHHGRVDKIEPEIVALSRILGEALYECMAAQTFWTSHPIRQVQEIDTDRRSVTRTMLRCLRVIGDHPGFRQELIRWHEPLHKRDLFVEVTDSYWVPLYPYVQVASCPSCKTDEIYMIDRWDGNNSLARLKSFERGHSEDSKETGHFLASELPPKGTEP